MRHGHRLRSRPRLQDSRINVLANLDLLPEPYYALRDAPAYPVAKSEALQRLLEDVHEQTFGPRQAVGREQGTGNRE
jgi:hypothetical protein